MNKYSTYKLINWELILLLQNQCAHHLIVLNSKWWQTGYRGTLDSCWEHQRLENEEDKLNKDLYSLLEMFTFQILMSDSKTTSHIDIYVVYSAPTWKKSVISIMFMGIKLKRFFLHLAFWDATKCDWRHIWACPAKLKGTNTQNSHAHMHFLILCILIKEHQFTHMAQSDLSLY